MKRRIIISIVSILALIQMEAQCPQFYNFYGVASSAPYWYSCSGNNFNLNIQSPNSIGPYTIDWGDGSAITSGSVWNPPTSVSHLYAATVDTFIVQITQTSTGCVIQGVVVMEEATSASIQIPVGGLTQACAPQDMEFINSSTNVSENTIFTWNFGDGSPPLTFDYTNWNQTITHTYQENTVDCETVVTLTAGNYCNTVQGGNSTATFNPIRIWDYDDAAITPSDFVLCWPDNTVSYTNTSEMNCFMQGNIAQRYEYWNLGDYWGQGTDSIIDWTPWPPTFPQTVSYPGIGSYTVMLLDSNFCGIDTAFVTINIVPPPTAGITANDDTICAGESIVFTNNSSAEANAWLINYGDGSGWVTMGASSASHTFNNAGDYSVGLVAYVSGAGASCTDTAWVDVHVLPGPIAAFTLSDTAECDSLTYAVTESSLGAISWNWNMGNGNTYTIQNPPDQNYTTVGNYNVNLTVTALNGCTDNTQQQVQVYQSPLAAFTTLDVCFGETAQFIDASTFHAGDPVNAWSWNFGDTGTSTLEDPTHVYAASGLYNVTLQVSTAHCQDDTLVQINVDTPPVTSFSATPLAGCSPLTVDFNNASTGAATFSWDFGDGTFSTDTNTTHVFTNNTIADEVFTIVLTSSNAFGCSSSDSLDITVYGQTTASFTSDATPGCAPYTVNFLNTSTGASGYQWNFGDGSPVSTVTSPSHLFTNNTAFIQYYITTLVAFNSNGCHDTTFQTVTSYPEPDFQFDVSGQSGCTPLSVNFPTIAGAVTYNWTFGDGYTATGAAPVHVYQNLSDTVQQYQVMLVASNPFGCVDTSYSMIEVYPLPTAQFTANPLSGCSPLEVSIENQSTLAIENRWIFMNGDTLITNAANQSYTYFNPGPGTITRNLRLRVTSAYGCQAFASAPINVYPQVTAAFSSITEGCSPLTVNFDDNSQGANNLQWTFGNGFTATGLDPSHVYQNLSDTVQTYQVMLVASNSSGCRDTAYTAIQVFPKPVAQFSADPASGCSPLEVQIENLSTLAFESRWVYGTGDTLFTNAINHSYTYYNTGSTALNRTMRLRVTSEYGCQSFATAPITVYPSVTASFNSITMGCSPLTVNFDDTSIGANSYQWVFGDGQFSFIQEPQHIYTNNTSSTLTMPVQFIVSNSFGCRDTAYSSIDVFPKPIAQFSAIPSTGCSPLDVTLNNSSTLAQNSQWIYGTGDTLIVNDPSHVFTYLNTGNAPLAYTLKLIVTSDQGCVSNSSQPINVYPEVHATFDMTPEGCSPLTVLFDNNTTGAASHLWSFGDGFQGITASPSHVYYNPGQADSLFHVQLTSTSIYGCTDTYEDTVVVHPLPIADFNVSDIEGCSPFTVNITDLSSGASSYEWSYGDGLVSDTSVVSHDHTYVSSSTMPLDLNLTLDLLTDFGCAASESIEITVLPAVNADFSTEEALCAGETFTFFNQSSGANSYQWTFGDGTGSAFVNPLHTYANSSGASESFGVGLLASSQYGCADFYEDTLTVHSAPIASMYIDSTSVCYPLYVEFINNSMFADSYIWDYGDGSNSLNSDSLHAHTFTNTSSFLVEYDISMIAVSALGCTDTTTTSVQVIPRLEADFAWVDNGCHPYPVDFNNESEGALNYQWIYSDGGNDTIAEPGHIFYNYGITDENFSIMLIANSHFGCADTLTQDITVYPLPDAEFVVTPVIQVYPNATVEILDNSVAGTATYAWTFGDGTGADSSGVTGHTYGTWGSYEISLVIDNGHCSDHVVQSIEIQAPPPTADFAGGGNGCAPITIQFENLSEYGTNYLWNFGDGGISMNNEPVYTYYFPGTYTVSLLVTGPGGNEISVHDTVVHVYPNATAYFTANPPIVNTGDPVYFYNLSNQANQFLWDFGDGQTSTQLSPVHVFQEVGSYDITLIANNEYNCPDTLTVDDAVLVDIGGYIEFPNAFTPDPLGGTNGAYDPNTLNNDVFFPVFAGVEDYQLQIYNRWGELLYESTDVNRGWDGYYKGVLVQQGVYVWRARVTFTDGKQVIRAGDLTLLR